MRMDVLIVGVNAGRHSARRIEKVMGQERNIHQMRCEGEEMRDSEGK